MKDKVETALVVGGGLAGMEAALKIGQAGYKVVLVEKQAVLGGVLGQLYSSFPRWEDPQALLNNKLQQIGAVPADNGIDRYVGYKLPA